MIDRLPGKIVDQLVDDEPGELLPVFSPAQIHRKGHIEYFQRRQGQPDMKRQAFAPPGFFFEREEARDEILVVFEARPPLLLDPADGELERDAGGLEQDGHQGEVDRNRLPDEIRRRVPVEVIEQGLQGAVWIDAVVRDQDPRRRRQAKARGTVDCGHIFIEVRRCGISTHRRCTTKAGATFSCSTTGNLTLIHSGWKANLMNPAPSTSCS
jgi:hypothetical protein